jgi:predicted alpha/beta superfamily hydrolase
MQTIYYMPGRGGRLNRGLGPALAARGLDVFGREITAEPGQTDDNPFARLSFEQQVQVVAHDLETLVSEDNPCVIGNSFGAYLIVQALLHTNTFVGRCLFLSPVLGPCWLSGMYFRPPQAGQLQRAIERGAFQNVAIDVVTGELDAQSPRALCEQLTTNAQGRLQIIEGEGHQINPVVIQRVLDAWL